jgi:probable F420-dependent oxidoreductase
MKLGAISFMTEYSIRPDEFAAALESHGYESMWAGDHTHIPVDPTSPAPILDSRSAKPLQSEYWHLMDPFTALSFAAAATSRIRLGVGICLVNERDPITTAKLVSSLDQLSGGRFIFGIGAGWNEQEMRNHGTDPRTRIRLMRERVEAMKAIWTNDVASYDGELVRFSPMMCWPKPLQQPHPPISIGGGAVNIPRVVAYADEWCPSVRGVPEATITEQIADLQRRAKEAGRDPIPVTAFHVVPVADLDVGSSWELSQERWDEYRHAGVDRVVVMLPPWREPNLRLIERYARFIDPAEG